MENSDPQTEISGRLTPIDDARRLYPLRRAKDLKRCVLYWLPLHSFPAPESQLAWLNEFLDRLIELLDEKSGLRPEVFLQYGVASECSAEIQKTAKDFIPMIGLGWWIWG